MKHTNKWLRLHGRLFFSVRPTPSKAKEFASGMAFKEVYDCEMLIRKLKKPCSVGLFAERIQR
jgi:hypothetical protein